MASVSAVTIDRRRVLSDGGVIVFALFSALTVEPLSYFLQAWFTTDLWASHWVAMLLATFCIFPALLACFARWLLLPFMRRPVAPQPEAGLRVAAVTTFVASGEPLEMLAETLEAMSAMDYPHDTWVLDEDNSPEVKRLCEALGVRHFSRHGSAYYNRDKGIFERQSKYGNYNAWLDKVGYRNYDYLVAFDPDHKPVSTFLSRVLGYFRDPKIAWVQLPQAYRNQSDNLIARGAAEETYSYNSSIQMASYGLGFVTMIGCHNTHRMAALKENGGFASHEADDMLTALAYQEKGWKGVFVPEILARGRTPTSWPAYLNQQRRWARSVLDIKLRRFPRSHGPSFDLKQRAIGFAHGLSYLYGGLAVPGFAALVCYAMVIGVDTKPLRASLAWPVLWLTLSIFVLEGYRQTFYLDRTERGLPWRAALLRVAKWPYFIAAMFDVATNRRMPYVITPKTARSSGRASTWPHWAVASMTLGAAFAGLLTKQSLGPVAIVGTTILAAASIYIAISIRRSTVGGAVHPDALVREPSSPDISA